MVLNERKITFFLTLIFLALLAGFLWISVPSFSGSLPGNLIGFAGTLIIFYTLVYTFRKRILHKKGKQNPLKYHVYAGLTGPSLIIIHSGHTSASWNGTLAFLIMVTIVLSGLYGRYLLRKINRSVKDQQRDAAEMRQELISRKSQIDREACARVLELDYSLDTDSDEDMYDPVTAGQCEELLVLARSIVETEYAIQGFSKTKVLFDRWLKMHFYLTGILFAMIFVHILSTVYYGLRWLP